MTHVLLSAQSEAGLSKGSYEHAKSLYRYSRDQRLDTPWHSCAQTGLLSEMFGALQFVSVSTEDRRSIAAV